MLTALKPLTVLTLGLASALALGSPALAAQPFAKTVILERGKRPATLVFTAEAPGETLLDLTAAAARVDWGRVGSESAVVLLFLDDRYAGDLVVPSSTPTSRRLALGPLSAGTHWLELAFADDRAPAGAREVELRDLALEIVEPDEARYVALRHAPILYGRSIVVANVEGAETRYEGPFQNAITDTPLLAWHEASASITAGNVVLEYSVVWSNEDGGTNSPALMARWGRTTDIEWIYRVEVDAAGNRVPGTAVYQGPDHVTTPFAGSYEGDHAVLQTCTSNNMVCADLADAHMRFVLAADRSRPAGRAREVLMDANPWTYSLMAAEMAREGRVESPSDPATPALGDQRTYLYLEVDKDTVPANPPAGPWVGVAVGVRLAGDSTVYRSDHTIADWSIKRDVPAATTVELPAGASEGDVVELIAYRVPVGELDHGAAVTVTSVNRVFVLDEGYLPQASFVQWEGVVTLTPAEPEATLWIRE